MLKQNESGVKTIDLCHEHGLSERTACKLLDPAAVELPV